MRIISALFLVSVILLSACARAEASGPPVAVPPAAVPAAAATLATVTPVTVVTTATATGRMPVLANEHPGTRVKASDRAEIDYSNASRGYCMVRFKAQTAKRLKVQVKGPLSTYSYDLTQGLWEAFPLSEGNGTYTVAVYENVSDNRYSTVLTEQFDVVLASEFEPFLCPNKYCDYSIAPNTVRTAAAIVAGAAPGGVLTQLDAVYDYVTGNFTYDMQLAQTVSSGYVPNLDHMLEVKKGICFDYAALMVGMLRSQGIPSKLVVGYAGTAYHAWISVYSEETGWIDNAVYFDGKNWQRMDPTFVSCAGNSAEMRKYVGDNSNYSPVYYY